jgi:hypothetical protein
VLPTLPCPLVFVLEFSALAWESGQEVILHRSGGIETGCQDAL